MIPSEPGPSPTTGPATSGAPHGGVRAGWAFDTAALLVSVFGAAAWFQPSVAGSDLWWHLAGGREIWLRGFVPRVDPFSFTFAGRPWTNHEWLWDAVFWVAYRAHPDAVAWLNLAVLVTLFGLLFVVSRDASGSVLGAGAALWMAAATAHWFLDIRPHLFTLLFVAVLLLTRERRWAPWLWPPVIAVWVNVHSGFVFGLGLIALMAIFRTYEGGRSAGRFEIPRREWIGFTLSCGAMLLNPYGARILLYPLSYLDKSSPFRSLIEWRPPGLGLHPATFQGRFWLMAAVVLIGLLALVRRAPFFTVLGAITFLMAATSRRFIPLFVVTGAPAAAVTFGLAADWLTRRLTPARSGAAKWAGTVVALAGALLLWRDVRLFPDLLYRWTQGYLYPEAAVRYLRAIHPAARLFNSYQYGGFLLLHAPEIKVFIDGRANTLYDDAFYMDFVGIHYARPGFRKLLDRYRIDAALLDRDAPLVAGLLSGPRPWREVYEDRVAVILAAPDSPLATARLPAADEVLAGDPERDVSHALEALGKNDLDAAAERLEVALRRKPLLMPAYGILAIVEARRGDAAAVGRAVEAGLRAEPRAAGHLGLLAGQAYEQLGRPSEALAAYGLAAAGPFDPPSSNDLVTRRLELQIEDRRKSLPH